MVFPSGLVCWLVLCNQVQVVRHGGGSTGAVLVLHSVSYPEVPDGSSDRVCLVSPRKSHCFPFVISK